MSLSHALRKSIGRWLIGVLLFAQFAVAAYACPNVAKAASVAAGITAAVVIDGVPAPLPVAAHGSPVCDQIDHDAANLCAEHCQPGQQRADTVPMPTLLAAVGALSYPLQLEPVHLPPFGRSFAPSGASLAAALPPAHAILHCVLRI
ncbi:MAG: hypothetical protein ABIO71_04695 [Caldimonas sp.]